MQGAFELLIKAYPKGRVSSYLHARREGDRVLIKGPFPKLAYTPNMTQRMLMIAGGTGIAPMVQVLHRVLDPATGDGTRVTLLFGSRTRGDILMKVRAWFWEGWWLFGWMVTAVVHPDLPYNMYTYTNKYIWSRSGWRLRPARARGASRWCTWWRRATVDNDVVE